MLEVEALGKRFGERWVFRSINFSLNKGDSLIVAGHNGAGKSTLLKTISGLIPPTEGKVRLPEGDPRTCIGLSALDMQVYHQLTLAEHMEFAAQMRGLKDSRVDLLEKFGLGGRLNSSGNELSTGMRARVKMALAIQAEPLALLLDEPGAGLDEAGRNIVDMICEEQRARGCLVIATNDPAERRLGNLELELAR